MNENVYKGMREGYRQGNPEEGYWSEEGLSVTVNGEPLPLRLDLTNHSPTGFEWGYGGSGPAQLALAIFAYEFGDNMEEWPIHYQAFKANVIATLPTWNWTLTSKDIRDIIEFYDK